MATYKCPCCGKRMREGAMLCIECGEAPFPTDVSLENEWLATPGGIDVPLNRKGISYEEFLDSALDAEVRLDESESGFGVIRWGVVTVGILALLLVLAHW